MNAVCTPSYRCDEGDSLGQWVSAARAVFGEMDYEPARLDAFEWRIRNHRLGELEIFDVEFDSNRMFRIGGRSAGSGSSGHYLAIIQTCGFARVSCESREEHLCVGDFMLFDTDTSYSIYYPDRAGQLVLRIPYLLLEQRVRRSRNLIAHRVSGACGTGAVFSECCRNVVRLASTLQPACFGVIERTILDLLVSCFLDMTPSADHRRLPRRALLRERIKRYIELNLANQNLTVGLLADVHGITRRGLHKLFEDDEITVDRSIWMRRLSRCRADLDNPRMADRTITEIALYWGFKDLSHFNRAFKAWTQMRPGDYRRRAPARDVALRERPTLTDMRSAAAAPRCRI